MKEKGKLYYQIASWFFKIIKRLGIKSKNDTIINFYAQKIINELNTLTGHHVDKDIIALIFSNFCIGKW